MTIYKITNKINGKAYIGQTTVSVKARWTQHKSITSKTNFCIALKSAIKKYGVENFSFEILTVCSDRQQLNAAEEYFIDHYQTLGDGGYNLTSGGDSRIPSYESRIKRSLALKGKSRYFKDLIESKRRMSEAKKGKAPWNKGLKTGQQVWNKGLSGYKLPRKKKV